MAEKRKRRSAALEIPVGIELANTKVWLTCRDGNGNFVCSLRMNGSRVEVYSGASGNAHLGTWTWEKLVEQLQK